MINIFVHIGYHKTGSTRLQQIFSTNPEINLIERSVSQRLFLEASPYDFNVGEVERELEKYVDPNKVNIISDEELSGNIHTGGNGRSITYEVIERLSKINHYKIHLMISIRNQVDMFDSCYRQYVKKGGCRPLVEYLYPKRLGRHRFRFPGFSFAHFKYSDVISHSFKKLGKENVTVFAYEAIRNSLESSYLEIFGLSYSYPGVAEPAEISNRSYNNFCTSMARLSNRFCASDPICDQSIFTSENLYRLLLNLYSKMSNRNGKLLLDESEKRIVCDFYAQDNALTADLTGIDLKKFGYSIRPISARRC